MEKPRKALAFVVFAETAKGGVRVRWRHMSALGQGRSGTPQISWMVDGAERPGYSDRLEMASCRRPGEGARSRSPCRLTPPPRSRAHFPMASAVTARDALSRFARLFRLSTAAASKRQASNDNEREGRGCDSGSVWTKFVICKKFMNSRSFSRIAGRCTGSGQGCVRRGRGSGARRTQVA